MLLGEPQKRSSKGLGKPSGHRKREQKKWQVLPTVPELAGTVERGSWTRDDSLQQLLPSSTGTAHPKPVPGKYRWLGPVFQQHKNCISKGRCPTVLLHCARLLPQPGPAWSLPGCCQARVCGKGSCSHRGRRVCPRVRRGWVHLHATQHLFSDLCSPFVSAGPHLFVWAWLLYGSQALGFFLKSEICF